MAIYHLTVKTISRSCGRSAVASIAYRRATLMADKRHNRVRDYRTKPGVVHSEITCPNDAPNWVKAMMTVHHDNPHANSETFWNFVESHERRKDAQLAREVEFALPIELTKAQNIALARDYIRDQFASRGMVADWSVHWDKGNPHVHVMLTMRALTRDGFGLKVRDWNKETLLSKWREKWAEHANFHLQLNRHEVRINHQSYQSQGIDLVPTKHQGRVVSDRYRSGITTAIMDEANAVRRENLKRIAVSSDALLKKITAESPTFKLQKLGQELGRYMNDRGKFSMIDAGNSADSIPANNTDQAPDSPTSLSPEIIAQLLAGIENHESVFSERELAKAVHAYTDNAELFARGVLQLKASNALIALGAGDDGRDRFTTRRMLALENTLQAQVDSLRARQCRPIPLSCIARELTAYQKQTGKVLNDEQYHAVSHVLKPSSISCLVGRAGTGKSFSLGAARAVWESQGLTVHGVTLSGIAADGLHKDAGINSRTIRSFQYAVDRGNLVLSAKSVVVMDEAGMTDTESMLAVLTAVEMAGAKLVLVGDHAQLQPVGAGASFRAMLERIGFAEIQTLYRQGEAWQQKAMAHFAAGQIDQAIQAYSDKGCVHLETTKTEAMAQLVSDWMRRHDLHPTKIDQQLVIAYENKDVSKLNTLLRKSRIDHGELIAGYAVDTQGGSIRISPGDRLLFLKNDCRLGVSNGRFASLVSVNATASGRVIDFQATLDGSDQIITINPTIYRDFMHGYATTVHKTQGVTVDHAMLYMGASGWNRHTAYVANTRHRRSCHLYASQSHYATLDQLKKALSRYGMKDSVLDFPLAFAERRGIDTSGLLKPFLAHLQRLSYLKTRIADRYARFIDPTGYLKSQQILAEQQKRMDALTRLREDARLVATYVDRSRIVGRAYQHLQKQLDTLGLEKISYDPKHFTVISQLDAYTALQAAVIDRNAAATALINTPKRFEKAFDIYGLDIDTIKAHAQSHTRREHVMHYQRFAADDQSAQRNQLAHQIMQSIKLYYPHICEAGIDTQILRQQAVQHVRSIRLAKLTTAQQAAFHLVEDYQRLSQELEAQFTTAKESVHLTVGKTDSKQKIRTHQRPSPQKAVVDLLKQRDALAATIMRQGGDADAALDFFQIGRSSVLVGDDNRDASCKAAHNRSAQARWYKLQQSAARHAIHEPVSSKQERRFDLQINAYYALRDACLENPFDPKLSTRRKVYAQKMVQDPQLMSHVQQKLPRLAKTLKHLSKNLTRQLSRSQDISLDL